MANSAKDAIASASTMSEPLHMSLSPCVDVNPFRSNSVIFFVKETNSV